MSSPFLEHMHLDPNWYLNLYGQANQMSQMEPPLLPRGTIAFL